MNAADKLLIAGVADTLIAAANNPVSCGGIEGLRHVMRAQAKRLRDMDDSAAVSAHTPGPWRYSEVIGGCFVHAGQRQLLTYKSSPDVENKANARLIAAAPDLLAAARLAQSILRRTLADEYHLGDDEQRAEAIAALRAAIAAATGPVSVDESMGDTGVARWKF